MTAAIGTDVYRSWPCTLTSATIAYAPRPMNACWPTDTTPANPASRFHIWASASKVNSSTILRCVDGSPHDGMAASTATPASATTAKIRLVVVPRATLTVLIERSPCRTSRSGRKTSTARNTMWPASCPHCGSIWLPINWATPSVMPPASVPHSEPSPPMTTASKAKMRFSGPLNGENDPRDAQQHAGQRHRGDRQRHRDAEHAADVDAHQSCRVGIVGGCPERPTLARVLDEQRQPAEHGDGHQQRDQRHPADADRVVDLDRRRLEAADVEALRVGRVLLEQRVLDDDAETERGHDLERRVDADDLVEHEPLQDVADDQRTGQRRSRSVDERVDARGPC